MIKYIEPNEKYRQMEEIGFSDWDIAKEKIKDFFKCRTFNEEKEAEEIGNKKVGV